MENVQTTEKPQGGIVVTYDAIPYKIRRGRRELIGLVTVLTLFVVLSTIGALLMHTGHAGAGLLAVLASLGCGLAGANTVTYDANGTIPAGVTAPTAAQAFGANNISAVITGDGAATSFVATHNWGLSAAQLTAAQPWVTFEPLLAAYYTANPLITTRATNSVTCTVVAFSGAAIRIRMNRPYSPDM